MNILKVIVIFGLVPLVWSCNNNEPAKVAPEFYWKNIGLSGLKVNGLKRIGNQLYAITNDGLYLKDISIAQEFVPLGLKGKNLLDIEVFSATHILASYRNEDWSESGLLETLDGGSSWSLKENDFGASEVITDLLWDKNNNTLYAAGYGVLAKSLNKGTTWQPIWGDWDMIGTGMMVEQNLYNPNELWFGGQGGIENGYLVMLNDGNVKKEWHDLVPNPTLPLSIKFDNQNPQNVYVGWEGKLIKTSDKGTTWKTLIDQHEEAYFFYGLGISETNPKKVFAAKWIKGQTKQPLSFYYSTDRGGTWKENVFLNETKGGVLDLVIKSENTKERIFLGLDGGGVYEVIIQNL